MVPGAETMAGAPPAADVTAESISNPAAVWVLTLNTPAAWLFKTLQLPPALTQVTAVLAGVTAVVVVHVQTSLVGAVAGVVVFTHVAVPDPVVPPEEVNPRVRKYPSGVVSTNIPPAGTLLTLVKLRVNVPWVVAICASRSPGVAATSVGATVRTPLVNACRADGVSKAPSMMFPFAKVVTTV